MSVDRPRVATESPSPESNKVWQTLKWVCVALVALLAKDGHPPEYSNRVPKSPDWSQRPSGGGQNPPPPPFERGNRIALPELRILQFAPGIDIKELIDDCFEELIANPYNQATILLRRATLYRRIKKYEEALADCTKASEVIGYEEEIMLERALIYLARYKDRFDRDDLSQSLQLLERLRRREIQRDQEDTWYDLEVVLAEALMLDSGWEEAEKLLRYILADENHDDGLITEPAKIHFLLADTIMHRAAVPSRDVDEAFAAFRKALELKHADRRLPEWHLETNLEFQTKMFKEKYGLKD